MPLPWGRGRGGREFANVKHWSYGHPRPWDPYDDGTEHIGFSPTRQALLARRAVGGLGVAYPFRDCVGASERGGELGSRTFFV